MFLKNPTFYYEKCLYYESIHHHKSANQSFIDGFKNLSETFEVNNNNDNENLKILKNNYFIFEERMRFRIERDLDGLIKEDWIRVDQFIHALIKNYKDQKKCMNDEESYEEQLKSINIDFNLREGKLIINDNNDNYINNKGLIIYKDDNDIKNDPDINRITSITCIWEILKNILSSLYVEWKMEYDKFDIQVQEKKNESPYSWLYKFRPSQRYLNNNNEPFNQENSINLKKDTIDSYNILDNITLSPDTLNKLNKMNTSELTKVIHDSMKKIEEDYIRSNKQYEENSKNKNKALITKKVSDFIPNIEDDN